MKRYIARTTSGIEIMRRAIGTFHAVSIILRALPAGEFIETLNRN